MERKIEREWMLLGFLMGFYGNWYFNLLITLETPNIIVGLVWGASFISLLMYCTEIISLEKSIIGKKVPIHLSVVLASIHPIATYGMIWMTKGNPTSLIYITGLSLWFFISLREVKILWLGFKASCR